GTGTLTKTSPLRKDIFLQIDYMDCTVAGGDCAPGDTHSHTPKQAAIDAMVRAFANAPAFVTNPDGSTGVTLHVSIGKAIAHQKLTRFPADFDALKEANFGHDNPLRSAFHYALMTHVMQPVAAGIAETTGNDLMTAMGDTGHACAGGTKANQWCNQDSQCPGSTCTGVADFDGDGLIDTDVGRIQDQASTIFHELGHNLGLLHGGSNNVNNKPNYVSIMNYTYSTGIPPTDPDGTGPLSARIDYSSTV